jgi:outer membrane immunogenic protein
MRYITRLGVAATAALGASLAAQAADLGPPVSRAPVYKEVYLWAGFYAGVNAGYGWSRTEVDPLGNVLFCNPLAGGCGPGSPNSTAQVASIPPSIGTNARGGLFGGQAGFNYQSGPYVLGVEADLDWTNLSASGTQGGVAPVVGSPGVFVATTATADQRLRYFGTLRARVGFAPVNLPYLLAYVTGGLAFGGLNSSTSVAQIESGCPVGCVVSPGIGSESVIRSGWTVGGGLEYLLGGNWSAKAEYLYFNLGSTSYSLSQLAAANPGFAIPFSTAGVTSNTAEFKGNLIRFGLNYKFAY